MQLWSLLGGGEDYLQREYEPCDHVNETKQAAHVTSTAALVSTIEAMAAQIGDANAWPKAWHMQDGQDDNISKENRYIQMQTHIYSYSIKHSLNPSQHTFT